MAARENLGTGFGLVAASALLIDYLLTAAVSLTGGVEAIASAFPLLWPHRILIALLLLAIITIANLRGLCETGTLMSIPVYLFLISYLPMLGYGFFHLLTKDVVPLSMTAPVATQPVTLFLILHTFATGCTALTGIEAISNGVPAFQPPETKNASRTLIVMAVLMGTMVWFISIQFTTHVYMRCAVNLLRVYHWDFCFATGLNQLFDPGKHFLSAHTVDGGIIVDEIVLHIDHQ